MLSLPEVPFPTQKLEPISSSALLPSIFSEPPTPESDLKSPTNIEPTVKLCPSVISGENFPEVVLI
jgi:hypothetical protein